MCIRIEVCLWISLGVTILLIKQRVLYCLMEKECNRKAVRPLKRDSKLYGTLFLQTLKLSAFTFGGGYVIISLMKKQFVDKLGWMNEKEMINWAG